ncbi:TonB-dependent receptor [Luteimonas saliphila]|uniref:TonB-dependent receptor n=1 Tax=Luteimonas saliphila TaxID=2804919 RepID=UPI00192DEE05|nr:TonB-dependent receptor [Luteimonas saliphila]
MASSKSIGPTRYSRLARAIGAALALATSGAALAQDAAADAAPDAQATELDRVIVTANKREEDIREVAVSMTRIGEQQLENLNATQMSDYASYVPGLQVQSSGTPGQVQVSMRGIAALSPGSTVGTYVDETPVGSNSLYQQATLYQLDLLPYDVESIEVLRGPQGTLYGAGAMGGLIKYTMRQPDVAVREFRVGGGVSFPEDGESGFNYRIGMNLPIVEDALAIRASFARNALPGYIDNLVDGRKDINQGHQTSARASLRWEGEGSSVQFAAMRQEVESDDNAVMALDPLTRRPVSGLSNYIHVDEPFRKEIDHYSLTFDRDLGFADFISATSYADTHTAVRSDVTLSYGEYPLAFLAADPTLEAGSSYLDNVLDMTQFTQEFRLQSKSGQRFEWLLGAFHSREKGDNYQYVALNQLDGSPLPAPWDGIIGVLGELYIPSTFEETAVFANGSFAFTDRFKIGAGVRFSRNDQEFTQNVVAGVLLPIATQDNTSSEDVFTWSITPQFQLGPDSMVYAKASTGYQPGGPNVVSVGLPSAVDSSTLTSYELGWKSAFASRRVLLDLVAYQVDWEDIQVASLVNGVSGLVNGGEATSRGLEASLQWRPTPGLTLGLNGAYNDAVIDEDFPVIVVPLDPDLPGGVLEINTGLKGDRMPYVPDLTVSATVDYYFSLRNGWSVGVGGGYRWVDDRTNATTEREVIAIAEPRTVLDTTITEPLVIDGYGALDVYASLSNGAWTLRGYVKNAADKRAYSTMTDVTGALTGVTHHYAASPIQPRTVGLELDFRF